LWIWILSILYFYNIIKFSPLYLSFFALLFTIYHSLIYKKNYNHIYYKLLIVFFEIFVLLVNAYKHFYIDKKKLLIIKDMIINTFIFLIYLLFLKIVLNKSFYEYYFVYIL
jgi:hypothetical protein